MRTVHLRWGLARGDPRLLFLLAALALLAALEAGCVSVDPTPDREEVARLVRDRTGRETPVAAERDESALRARVDRLLEGGLTVEEAERLALLVNPRVGALLERVGVARADLVEAGLPANPSFGLSFRPQEGGGRANVTYTFAQSIIDWLLIPARQKAARRWLESERIEVARELVDLVFAVRRAGYRILGLRLALEAAGRARELAAGTLRLARNRFEAGQTDRLDIDLERAGELEARRDEIALGRDLERARAELAALLGLARLGLEAPLVGRLPEPDLVSADAARLIEEASARRLDVRAAAMRVEASKARVSLEWRRALPAPTVGVEYERAEAPPSLGGPTLDLTLPLWHQNQAGIARAESRLAQSRREYEVTLERASGEVRAELAAARGDRELLRLYEKELLPLARANVETARRAYRAGRREILVLTEARAALVAREREYAAAIERYALSLAGLERAVGGRLPSPSQESREPAGSENPQKSERSGESRESENSAKPAESPKPAMPAESEKRAESENPASPANPEQSAIPAKPREPEGE